MRCLPPMSASAILSPVTVPLAGKASGPSTDTSDIAGAFAAAVAAEIAETPVPSGSEGAVAVTIGKVDETPVPSGSEGAAAGVVAVAVGKVAEDLIDLAERTSETPADAAVAQIWLQFQDVSTLKQTGEGPAPVKTETTVSAPPSPTPQPIFTGVDKALTVPQGAEATTVASEGEVAPAAEPAKMPPSAPTVEPAANRKTSAAGEAALAALRAMPGAAALHQATITQRKIEAPVVSSAAVLPETTEDSVETEAPAKAGIRAIETAVAPALAVKPAVSSGAATQTGEKQRELSPQSQPAAVPTAVDDLTGARTQKAPASLLADPLPPTAEPPSGATDTDATSVTGTAPTSSMGSLLSTSNPAGSLSSLSRATIETTAQLAAQITQRLAGQSTRFELGLTPEGLGRVDVTLDIDSDGQLSARLAFDNPLAATELRGRADDLRRQLEDAGFTLARDALDFSSRDNSSGGGTDRRQQRATAYADRHAAQSDLTESAPVWALPSSSSAPRGVDVKV